MQSVRISLVCGRLASASSRTGLVQLCIDRAGFSSLGGPGGGLLG